ncbi:MAG: AAA family ATPase [Verrucomicrobia bacterium]|nr:AAA family ATPase [Verrucomicrobiota bacterium]
MPIRLYEIAKKLGIDNKQVLAKARALGITAARVASSSLDRITSEYLESQLRDELAAAFRRGFLGLALGNFKAFADTQNVPIRPLTLVFGANSSGKSSVLHGLLLARHAVDTGELDITRTEIGGDSVDLGGFRQYVHRREASRRVEWSAELDVGTLRGQGRQLLGKHKAVRVSVTFGVPLEDPKQPASPGMGDGQPWVNGRPWVVSYEIEAGSSVVLRLSRRPDGAMHLDRLDTEYMEPLVAAVLQSYTTVDGAQWTATNATMRKVMDDLIPTLRFTARGLLPDKLLGEEYATGAAPQLVPIQKAERLEQLMGAVKLFVPRAIADVVLGVNAALIAQLGQVRYLGPLRSFPPRHLAFSDDRGRNWLAGGGYAWDVVRTDEGVRNAVNRWLGSDALKTRYELQIRTLGPMDEMERSLADAIEGLPIEVIEEGHQPDGPHYDGDLPVYGVKNPQAEAERIVGLLRGRISEKYDELALMDLRSNTPVAHRDVGIGVSQVLPVLVHAYADEGKIVAIEQPEIHLHPALQAELGDVFIESALGERRNTFLLETHSEHLILRILRRVRETTEGKLPVGTRPVRPEDVSVLFVEPTNQGSVIQHLPVTPDGDFGAPWPGGFFAERFQDLP